MRLVGFALFAGIAALGYAFWGNLAAVTESFMLNTHSIAYLVVSASAAVLTAALAMPAVYGMSWKTHNELPETEVMIPCQAGGPDKHSTDKVDRRETCYCIGVWVFVLSFVGLAFNVSALPVASVLAFGYIALLANTRVLLGATA